MKFHFKQLFLLLLLLCFGSTLSAQLIIAKDPRECLTGLKDSSGNWVVPARYNQIEYYGGNYRVVAGGKEGVVSWSGKVLVPAVYDNIEYAWCQTPGMSDQFLTQAEQKLKWRYSSYFITFRNGKKGLFGPGAREIIAPSLLSMTAFLNGVAIGVNEQNQSVLIDTTGILCTLPSDCSIYPDVHSMIATKRFIVTKKGTDKSGNTTERYGVCNERGKFILPAVYGGFYSGLWRMNVIVADSAAGHYGVFSLDGKQLSPCCYRVEKTPVLNEYTFNDFVFVSRNGKAGVLGRQGKLIVPCSYDSIGITRKSMNETLFLGHAGTHEDLYSDTKPLLVNHAYDEVRITQNGLYYFNPLLLILVSKNQKWGALSESLKEYMPVEFDTVFTDAFFSVVFYSDSSVRALYLDNSGDNPRIVIVPRIHEEKSLVQRNNLERPYYGYNDTIGQPFQSFIILKSDTGTATDTVYWRTLPPVSDFREVVVHHVWTTDSVHLIWELPVGLDDLEHTEANDYNHDITSCFAVVHSGKSSVTKYDAYKTDGGSTLYISTLINGSRIYKSTGGASIVPSTDKMYFYLARKDYEDTVSYIAMHSASGKQGAMDMNGKILLDTLWYGYHAFNADTFWVATAPHEWYDECSPVWNMYSYSQHQLLLDKNNQFISVPYLNPGETGPVFTATGVGLFDTRTLRFTIAPVYRYIYPLDDSLHYFLVTDFNGVTRITDQKGKAVNKLIVEQATILNKSSSWYYSRSAVDSLLLYSVRTPGATLIIGNGGIHNYRSLNRDSLFSFLRQQPAMYMLNGAGEVPFVLMDSATVLQHWQRVLLCDLLVLSSMNGDYRASPSSSDYFHYSFDQQNNVYCDSWPAQQHDLFYHESRDPVYAPGWSSKNVLCLRTQHRLIRETLPVYDTYFLQDSVPVKQQLSDLFLNDQWKPVIINALLARLDSQPQIRANCTDVNRYPELLANRFLVAADSLLLFPDWGMDLYLGKPEICVAISWSELMPFLRPEAKEAMEIH